MQSVNVHSVVMIFFAGTWVLSMGLQLTEAAVNPTFSSALHKNRLASLGISVMPVSPDLLRVTSLYSCRHTRCIPC